MPIYDFNVNHKWSCSQRCTFLMNQIHSLARNKCGSYSRRSKSNFLTSPLGDKVSMLTHIYPHKAQRKIEVTICQVQFSAFSTTPFLQRYFERKWFIFCFDVNHKLWHSEITLFHEPHSFFCKKLM